MAGKTATILKAYFAKYAKPTAEQFAELIDTLYEKAASVLPQDTNSFNLGSITKQWKDIYSSGEAFITKITASGLAALKEVKAQVFYNNSITVIPCDSNVDIELSNSNVQSILVDQNCQIGFHELRIGMYKIILTQDSVGGYTVTFGAGVIKVGSVGTVANQVDILNITCDGAVCYVEIINDFKQ